MLGMFVCERAQQYSLFLSWPNKSLLAHYVSLSSPPGMSRREKCSKSAGSLLTLQHQMRRFFLEKTFGSTPGGRLLSRVHYFMCALGKLDLSFHLRCRYENFRVGSKVYQRQQPKLYCSVKINTGKIEFITSRICIFCVLKWVKRHTATA